MRHDSRWKKHQQASYLTHRRHWLTTNNLIDMEIILFHKSFLKVQMREIYKNTKGIFRPHLHYTLQAPCSTLFLAFPAGDVWTKKKQTSSGLQVVSNIKTIKIIENVQKHKGNKTKPQVTCIKMFALQMCKEELAMLFSQILHCIFHDANTILSFIGIYKNSTLKKWQRINLKKL